MIRCSLIRCLAAGFISVAACNRPSGAKNQRVEDHYIPDPSSVGLDIDRNKVAVPHTDGSPHIRPRAKQRPSESTSVRPNPLMTNSCEISTLRAEMVGSLPNPELDASVLLADLKKALEAKTLPLKVERVRNLPFQFVSLGKHQSQAFGGGFNAKPPGNWTPMKIFIGEGEQEGEVFLNLNPAIKKGQFSIKDADYGDIVLAQLARVL